MRFLLIPKGYSFIIPMSNFTILLLTIFLVCTFRISGKMSCEVSVIFFRKSGHIIQNRSTFQPQKGPIVVQSHDLFDAASKSMTIASMARLFWIRNSNFFDSFVATSQSQTATQIKIKRQQTLKFTLILCI